ncbi:unnamed protein product [Mytilus coruscus]|uniref:Uncharacterized protein n=1 Tax=Mytilus coruscus TaxID=42192 RepID=A0A6J8B311_MYTCO|nr:unnamed protein product [Mytilus coruscus]
MVDKCWEIEINECKTLAHPASASKTGLAKKILETIRDQENIQKIQITKTLGETCKPKSVDVVSSQPTMELSSQTSGETKGNVEKGGKKRKKTESNAPAKKKSKTETKSCRRKLLPQVKDSIIDNCIFCEKLLENGEPTVKLGKKGCDNINKISSDRQKEILTVPGQTVHHDCRRDFINLKSTRWKISLNVDPKLVIEKEI